MVKIFIPEKLPGLNEYISAERSNRYKGAEFKRKTQNKCIKYIKRLKVPVLNEPVMIEYIFHETNKRRDHDNVSGFAHKVIQDALVASGVLKNDGWNNITGYIDRFVLDKAHPGIEVIIWETTDGRNQMDQDNDRYL